MSIKAIADELRILGETNLADQVEAVTKKEKYFIAMKKKSASPVGNCIGEISSALNKLRKLNNDKVNEVIDGFERADLDMLETDLYEALEDEENE